jgi:Trk-type K+ transport system membrane component
MWIGASPGSTGGGIKTTTVAISLLNIHSIASGRNRVELFRKKVSDASITKAFCTLILSFIFIQVAVLFLLLTEKFSLEAVLFEVVSALSTVGLTMGITSNLSTIGKAIIVATMFVGRVGLLAVVMALTRKREDEGYEYTSENVLVT